MKRKRFPSRSIRVLAPGAAALCSAAVCVPALVLLAPPRAASAAEGQALAEVVVSARRREETVQDVPVAVTAFDAAALEARNVHDISQVAEFTPNLQFDNTAPVSGSSIASTVFIRGVGQTDFTLNSDPGVGIYIDGVYVARSVGGLLDLVDVERVEVLRGPQGTLFGKNTIGGAINITTRKPSADPGGHLEFRGGNFSRTDIRLRFDAPLSEDLRTSFAGTYLNRDGYQERLLGGDDLGDVDRFVGRARALYEPNERLSVDLSFDYTHGREESTAQSILFVEPNTGAPFIPAANGDIPGTASTLDPTLAGRFPNARFDDRWITDDPFETFQTGPSRSNFDIYGVSATIVYDFELFQVKSISAYRKVDSEFARDADGSPFLVVHTEDEYDQEQVSQELQLLGTSLDERLQWLAGFYFLQEDGTNLNLVPTSIGALNSGGEVDNTTWALFGQASYEVTDALSATLGLRYTEETKRFNPGFPPPQPQFFGSNANGLALGLPPALPLVLAGENEADTDNVDVTASIQYAWTQDLMTYASFSTGFKSGGFSQRIGPSPASPLDAPPSFDPEEVAVYELGFKWQGLSNRARVNAAVFFSDYDDIQITPLFEGIGPVTRNAGEAEIWGAELEWLYLPVTGLELSGGVGWLETEYTELSPEAQVNLNLDGTPVLTEDTELANSPEWSVNASASYEWPLAGYGVITARLDWSYTSELFNDVLNTPELTRDELHLVGARLAYETRDGNWTLSLSGRNLTDETYLTSGNAERFAGNIGYTQGVFARPREWWVSLRRRF